MASQDIENGPPSVRRRRGGRKPTISREQILATAEKFAPEDLSIPALASSLGVTHAGIYHYFSSRAELVSELVGRASRRLDVPPRDACSWEEWVVEAAFVLRGHFIDYANTLDVLSIGASLMFAPLSEALLEVLLDAGFTINQAADAGQLIGSCAIGGAISARRGHLGNADLTAVADDLRVPDDSPLRALAADVAEDDLDEAFRRCVTTVVEGLKTRLAPGRAAR